MWKVLIVEDEKHILNWHASLLEAHDSFQLVGCFKSPVEALQEIPKLAVDILLLDIEMPGMTGFELAQHLLDSGIDIPIVFTTAYQQYALQAFRVQALDYLMKPIDLPTINQLDERLRKHYGNRPKQSHTEQLHVQLYGQVYAKKEAELIKWPTRITEELFYYFLLHDNKLCSKWRIIDDLWGDIDNKRTLSNLHNTIYRLRQMFAELNIPIVIDRISDGYIMNTNNSVIILPKEQPHLQLLESKGYLWAYRVNSPM